MREIIFRGKRVDNGEWVEGNLIQNDDFSFIARKSIYSKIGYCYDCDRPFPDDEMFEVKPESIGQFIGLTDKSGKKIFEGDIVELIVIGGYRHKRYKVFYDNETAQWLMKNGEGIDDCDKFYGQQVRCNMIVIGNIFDNPDLLEEV